MPTYVPAPLEHQDFPRAEISAVQEAMKHVLHSWAYLPSGSIGAPVEGPAHLPLERSVRLSGRSVAFLNIRTNRELSGLLSQYARGEEVPAGAEEDAFQEFVNIYCGHLMTYLWGKEGSKFESFLPVPTTPADWPTITPSASCAFLVENIPVEVRLWIKGARS
jgi:hypothetical protein